MADMTLTIAIRGTKAGNSFEWERTATIADIEHASLHVNDNQGTANPLMGDTSPGVTANDYTALAVSIIISKTTYGLNSVQLVDSGLGIAPEYVLGPNMPFIVYAGYDFNGAFNSTNTATDGPTVDLDSVNVIAIGTARRFAAMFGLKPIS